MPVVHEYKDGRGLYIKANQGGRMTTYQVTPAGVTALRRRGCREGSKLTPGELVDLVRQGLVHTGGSGAGVVAPPAVTPPMTAPVPVPGPHRPAVPARPPERQGPPQEAARRERKRRRHRRPPNGGPHTPAAPTRPAPEWEPLPSLATDPVPPEPPFIWMELLGPTVPSPGAAAPADATPVPAVPQELDPASPDPIPQADDDDREGAVPFPQVTPPADVPPPAPVEPPPPRRRLRRRPAERQGGNLPDPAADEPAAGRAFVAALLALFIFVVWLAVFGFLAAVAVPADSPAFGRVAAGLFVVAVGGVAAVVAYRSA